MSEPRRLLNDEEWMRDDCQCFCDCHLWKEWTDGLCDSCHRHTEELVRYLMDVRLALGEWPKAMIVHPYADLDTVKEAISIAKARLPDA